MRKLVILSVILIIMVTLVLGGCGTPPPAAQLPSWRERVKYPELDQSIWGYRPEVADYPELTDAAALELFKACRDIAGIGYLNDEFPTNIVKSFNPEEYCNVYTIADSWFFLDVRTRDARIIKLKNGKAGEAPDAVQGLNRADALARADAIEASIEQAENSARQSCPGVAERQRLEYTMPVINGPPEPGTTGCWRTAWARVATAGIPFHGSSPYPYPGESIRITLRVDGLFLESETHETVACEDTQPVITEATARETAQPVIDKLLKFSQNPLPATTVSLAYVVPGYYLVFDPNNAEGVPRNAVYPNQFRLAWVVAVGPHPRHPEVNWVEVWVDALTGDTIGTVRNDLCH